MENFSTMQDKELVALLKEGSQKAFKELYARYKYRLISYCKRYLKNSSFAEDIVHDIFMQLWKNHDTLQIDESFSGYIYTLVKNHVLKEIRHSDVHERYAAYIRLTENDTTNQTEDTITENDYAKIFDEMLEKLSPRQKEIFLLSRIQGFTHKEIAEKLQISVHVVNEHSSLALKKIKKYLTQHTDINIKAFIISALMIFP